MSTSTGSSTPPRRWSPAPHVVTVLAPHATVLIDNSTGAITALTDSAEQVWETHSHDDASSTIAPDVARTLTDEFLKRGWLVPLTRDHPSAVVRVAQVSGWWGSREIPACLDHTYPAPWRWRLAAIPALAVTLAVRQLGCSRRRFARLLALARLGSRYPDAAESQAQHAVRSVRWVARLTPARVACLEESVTAALLLALAGRSAAWRHGIATDPFRLHAWIAGPDSRPIDEPADTDLYVPINIRPYAEPPLWGREGTCR